MPTLVHCEPDKCIFSDGSHLPVGDDYAFQRRSPISDSDSQIKYRLIPADKVGSYYLGITLTLGMTKADCVLAVEWYCRVPKSTSRAGG